MLHLPIADLAGRLIYFYMLNFANVSLHGLAVHRVGNKQRAEKNFVSDSLVEPSERLRETLLDYFIKPFKRNTELYQFVHSSDLNLNEIYSYATTLFQQPENLLSESVNILQHLYNQSMHPNIKRGELYVALFSNVLIDDELVDAVGIFKSERKAAFLKVDRESQRLVLNEQEGINLEKLDKGCLILNTRREEGYRVLTVDNNQYDASYWLYQFLHIDYVEDENFHTKMYLEMVNDFAGTVVGPKTDQREKVKVMANTVDYFTTNQVFNEKEFKEHVLSDDKELWNEFDSYRAEQQLPPTEDFQISAHALKAAKRKIKTTIKLDTNIRIKLDAGDPQSTEEYIERGYDEEQGMSFYKIYFNEEIE